MLLVRSSEECGLLHALFVGDSFFLQTMLVAKILFGILYGCRVVGNVLRRDKPHANIFSLFPPKRMFAQQSLVSGFVVTAKKSA